MKKELVGVGHIKAILGNLEKCKNLLNSGKDVLPYSRWQDDIDELIEKINSHELEKEV
jgi:hypothetical protein